MRKYRATAIRKEAETGVGIEEYAGQAEGVKILAIHSLYIPEHLSNRDACLAVMEHIQRKLPEGEQARVRLTNVTAKRKWQAGFLNVEARQVPFGRGFNDALKLAKDAIARKDTIYEELTE